MALMGTIGKLVAGMASAASSVTLKVALAAPIATANDRTDRRHELGSAFLRGMPPR